MKIYKFMSLYHYCCDGKIISNKYTKQCIVSQEVFFNDWQKLNDPMEGFYSYYPNLHDKNIEQILTESKKKYKIFCCSKNYDNILMWSHYADSHKGICLEIEVNETTCNENDIFHLNVVYKKDLVSLLPNLTIQDQAKHILKHKLSKWSYEEEMRFFVEDDIANSFQIGEIKSILLGSKCSDEDKKIIKEWNKNISIKNMTFDQNRMEIQ